MRTVPGGRVDGLLTTCFDVVPVDAGRDLIYRVTLEHHERPGERYAIRSSESPVEENSVRIDAPE